MMKKVFDRGYVPNGVESLNEDGSWCQIGDDFGSVFDDVWDDVKSVGDTIGDAVPDWAKKAFSDFADSAVGHVVLFAVSGNAYYALAPTLGAQLAAVTFALPGMARGENFMKAWTEGFMERVTLLIKYFMSTGVPQDAATQEATQLAQDGLSKCKSFVDSIGGPDKLGGMTFQELAKKAGVREDIAAEYLANAVGNLSLPQSYKFDPKTGAAVGKLILNWKDKARLIQASVDPTKADTAQAKARAIGNMAISRAQHQHALNRAPMSKRALEYGAGGATLGVAAALLAGASAPVAAGAAATLAIVGYFVGRR